MPKPRAHWTPGVTRTFLELCVREKNKLNWEYKQLTKLGWQNLYPDFYKTTGLKDWERKKLQNKLRDLRTHFIKWRNLNYRQSGLGRDTETGAITAPPDYWDDSNLDSSPAAIGSQVPEDEVDPRRAPPCVDLLFELFGHLPNDRGSLITSGGHTEASSPGSDPATPPHARIQGSGSLGQGPSSKRPREQEVTSPHKKLSAGSVGESLQAVAHSLKTIQQTYAPDASEIRRVHELLHEDGISEADDDYIHAVLLCRNPLDRMSFLSFATKEGRLKWIRMCWAERHPSTD
ncbi:unnamed protein product [Urochloa humidicola]